MAQIIGGIGTSHVPTIAMAFDKGRQNDPDWQPLFRGYEAVAKWLGDKKPDVLFFCFNDHATTFFFDHYPTFALGVSEEYRIADEPTTRLQARQSDPQGDPELSARAEGGDGRHRGTLAPDDRRARRLQRRRMGPQVPRSHRPRPGAARRHDHRGLYAPWRQRGRRSDHVADHARRPRRRRPQGARQLLPADDHRHGRGALRINGDCHHLMGQYVFDLERSARGLRLNRFLHSLTRKEVRELFLREPEAVMKDLTAEEREMVRRLDWKAMQNYGASFFCLEKLARAKGVSNPEMVAAFRGESLEAFLKTRRVPGAR